MGINDNRLEPADLASFHENRAKFPPEQLLPFAGKYLAWNPEGTRILASGETMDEVEEKLLAVGIHPSQVVGDYVPPADVALL
jgi:hypothetical protein